LHRETKKFHSDAATAEVSCAEVDASWDIGTFDKLGFRTATSRELGRLWGLLFVQGQWDGVSRIQLFYGAERMIYTIAGADYEMVPPPAPLNMDMCRLLARASKLRWGAPGKLRVSFTDLDLELVISHGKPESSPAYIEISGFTGNVRQAGPTSP
jgi:hypothetical protein